MQQLGVGLAVAIFLDATIVRGLLVPAVMSVLGEHNWYLPRWIDRLLPPQGVDPQELPASPAAFRQAAWDLPCNGGRPSSTSA